MRTHTTNPIEKPYDTLTVMRRHNEMQRQHASGIQDIRSPHVMRPIALTPLAHHRLVIRRLEPTLDTIRANQENIIIRVHTITTIERQRFRPVRQFDQFRQITQR